ncbi:MAG TPA: hypothetical protein VGG33_07365 [Polyangia bacterium]
MSSVWRFAIVTMALVVLLAVPTSALACPSCATREGAGIGVFVLIGAMITVPYLVALVTIRVMRRLEREP